ncbi:MAG: MATE family efflux transporter [Pseudobacteriovorax sp.]|nr:MATE family efflux transporter [Pseudobacteriovorax sp.]
MQQGKFTRGRIRQHLLTMTMSSSIGLVAMFFVDLVDMYFISLLGESELAAAVGYAGTVLFFTLSFSIGLSIASGAMCSRALGGESEGVAKRIITHTWMFPTLIMVPVALVIWATSHGLLQMLGAEGQTLFYAQQYLDIILPSTPLVTIAMVGATVLRSEGEAQKAMWVTLTGGIFNAIFDPIFIFALDLRIEGAAIASVLSRFCMVIYVVYQLVLQKKVLVPINLLKLGQDLRDYLRIAFPAVLTNLSTPIGVAYVTRAIADFGDSAVAGNAIVSKLQPVAFAAIFALSGSVGPIIGQNYGAKNFARVRETLRESMRFVLLYCLLLCAILWLVRDFLIWAFQAENEAKVVIQLYCNGLSTMFVFNGIIFYTNAAFNNLGFAHFSTLINFFKATAGTIPFVFYGALWGGLEGLWYGMYLGLMLTAILSWGLCRYSLRQREEA